MNDTTNTLYEVRYRKDGSGRVILVTDNGEGPLCKSFGFGVSVFDVSRILGTYSNNKFDIKRISLSKFMKEFGQACKYASIEL